MAGHMIPLCIVGTTACGIQGTKDGTCIYKTPPQCPNNGTYQSKQDVGQPIAQEVLLSVFKGAIWAWA
jgi:hypothetical protein